MPLAAEALIHPKGRVHPDLFPERSSAELEADVQNWLDEAYASPRVSSLEEVERDEPARAWAEYRAFDAASIAMAANPASSAQSDAGSASYSKDQRDRVARWASEALARFNELAPAVTTDRWTGGRTVEHNFAW